MNDFDDLIGQPGPSTGGGGFNGNKKEHLDHLVVFVRPEAETRKSAKNEDYDVAVCSYVLCLDCHNAWTDQPVSGKSLVPALLNALNPIPTGRLILGEAKENQNAPFLLEDATEAELVRVREVFAKYAVKMPTGKIVFDTDTFKSDDNT